MAAEKILSLGIAFGVVSTAFLFSSLLTDNWFVIDSTEYRKTCREDELLKQLYPWAETKISKEDSTSKEMRTRLSAKGKETTTPQQITLGSHTESGMDRPYNDWPGLPLKSPNYEAFPAPLMQANKGQSGKYYLRKNTTSKTKSNKTSSVAPLPSRKNNKWNRRMHVKVAVWNQLVRNIQFNLLGFGGRDTSFDRSRLTQPSGERSNECVEDVKKSIKSNETPPCKVPDCNKRQFSTHAGLWRTCLTDTGNPVLAGILSSGSIPQCAPVRYSDAKIQNLPENLVGKEKDDVYKDEWKVLHLRRILASFLCMAAPVQIFGVGLVCCGWMFQRGFVIYAGGLVLIMSGTFQLLAIGTSGLLFDLELNREPKDIYDFPYGVTKKFGRSAHAIWVSSGCAIFSGLLCAIAPSIFSIGNRRDQKHLNGAVTAHISRSDGDSSEQIRGQDSVEIVVNINSSPSSRHVPLKNQAYSVDTGTAEMGPLIPIGKLREPEDNSKTYSAPNLCEYSKRRRGRSSTRRSRRTQSPVATVWTPHSASESLNLLNDIDDEKKSDQEIKIPTFQCNFQKSPVMSDSFSDRSLKLRGISSKNSLSYSQSLTVPNRSLGLSCWATVDISQRLRHARYARRTSHSCEETASRIRNIMRGLSLDEERRTRSLPRPTMRHTPLSELSISSGGSTILRDHCEIFLQRHGLSPCSSEIIPPKRGRAAYLNALARNNSDDAATRRARLLHPAVSRWSNEGTRWSRGSEESQRNYLSQSMSRDSTRSHLIEREGTLDSVRECSESDETSPTRDNVMKNSSDALANLPENSEVK